MALGAMRAITESGLRVGADISVVGIRRYRRQLMLYPAVNHHQTGFRLLGQTSVDRLLQLSQGQAVKGTSCCPSHW
ncbi:hypothetical protein ACVXG9_24020 [Escherichia coli]